MQQSGVIRSSSVAGKSIDQALAALFCLAMVWVFAVFCWYYLPLPRYSPDSWAYYELSKTVFNDFYRFNTWRQFWTDNPYSNSFPPAWPVIIAIANAVTGIGPRMGSILSITALVAAAVVAERVARHRFNAPWCGLVAMVIIFGSRATLESAAGGRTETAAMLVAVGCAALITAKRFDAALGVALGLLSGVGVLLRFDWLPCAVLMTFVVRLRTVGWRPTLAYLSGLGLMIAPWVIFSISHFQTLFASDNRAVVLAVDSAVFVTDWRPDGVVTFYEDPIGWLQKVFLNVPRVVRMAYYFVFEKTPLLVPVGASLMLLLILNWRRITVWLNDIRSCESRVQSAEAALFLFLFVFLGMVPLWLATGYTDARYVLPALACMMLGSLVWVSRVLPDVSAKGQCSQIFRASRPILVLGLVACAAAGLELTRVPMIDGPDRNAPRASDYNNDFTREVACLEHVRNDRTVLVFGKPKLAAQFGALTGWPTSFEPTAMPVGQDGLIERRLVTDFLQRFRIGAVWLADHQGIQRYKAWDLDLLPIPNCEASIFTIVRQPASTS